MNDHLERNNIDRWAHKPDEGRPDINAWNKR